jgi:hypothetical protein
VGQKERKIVANDQIFFVNPDLLAHDADSTRTPKFGFVISLLARARLSSHERILAQVMHLEQHLQLGQLLTQQNKGPLVSGPSEHSD